MTKQALERAKEIESTIYELRAALLQISKGSLFNIENHMGCVSRMANPLLAEIENEIKSQVQNKILAIVSNLNEEFDAL